jgi:hypothetical protein
VWNNGFPSGPHLTLNIHGKKDQFKDSETCALPVNGTCYGGSIFIPEYTNGDPSLIQYVMNKKSNLSELCVIDPCSFGSDDPAIVKLPKGEYQVYARILAKPGKPGTVEGEGPRVAFYPRLLDACNQGSVDEEIFGDYWNCDEETLIGLGVATSSGSFYQTEGGLERIAPLKGKNKAVPFTQMFWWSGWVLDEMYDIDGDGYVELDDLQYYENTYLQDLNDDDVVNTDDLDVALPYGTIDTDDFTTLQGAGYSLDLDGDGFFTILDLGTFMSKDLNMPDFNNDGYVDITDVDLYPVGSPDGAIDTDDLNEYLGEYGTEYTDEWIFNIADMVIYGWDYNNYGSKLVQVRFYPVAETEFIE